MSLPTFLRMPQVAARVGMSPRQVYRLIKEGQFPPQRRLSHKVAVWRESDVAAWVEDQWEAARAKL